MWRYLQILVLKVLVDVLHCEVRRALQVCDPVGANQRVKDVDARVVDHNCFGVQRYIQTPGLSDYFFVGEQEAIIIDLAGLFHSI